MAASGPQQAKRALAKVLLTLAALYPLHLDVARDSADDVVTRASRRMTVGQVAWPELWWSEV